jgi:hypothetical protein
MARPPPVHATAKGSKPSDWNEGRCTIEDSTDTLEIDANDLDPGNLLKRD